jgi:hypothetical protein
MKPIVKKISAKENVPKSSKVVIPPSTKPVTLTKTVDSTRGIVSTKSVSIEKPLAIDNAKEIEKGEAHLGAAQKEIKAPRQSVPVKKKVLAKANPKIKPANVNSKVLLQAAINTTPPVDQAITDSLRKKPAGSLESDIRIFQIYYESWQKELLDPAFASLDNANGTSELLEFDVFRRLASSAYVKDAKLWGALSWRFAEKTGMAGQDLLKVILSNPGFDVYFCNPVPENEALYHNLWQQGETSHPQFLSLVHALFKAVELPEEELIGIESDSLSSAANYFVATSKFWSIYLPWVQNVLTVANKKLPPQIRDLLHSSLADDRGLHGGATYIPFIVERLFPLFMKLNQSTLKGFKVALPERDRELNVHVKLLREMKEISHKTKSAWLAACWVNYRNLYLTQVRGKGWCQQNLANITPKEIRFI